MSIHVYCRDRMRGLRSEYLEGNGYGDIFEVCFLTYLEVLEAAEGRDPGKVWDGWRKVIKEESDGEQPLNRFFGESAEGRGKLVEALDRFVGSLALPRRKVFRPPPSSVGEAEETPDEEPFGLIGSLFGDETT